MITMLFHQAFSRRLGDGGETGRGTSKGGRFGWDGERFRGAETWRRGGETCRVILGGGGRLGGGEDLEKRD